MCENIEENYEIDQGINIKQNVYKCGKCSKIFNMRYIYKNHIEKCFDRSKSNNYINASSVGYCNNYINASSVGYCNNYVKYINTCSLANCNNNVKYKGDYCFFHGGKYFYFKCLYSGCTKYARHPTHYCFSHGGGRRCQHPDHIITEFEPFPPPARYKLNGIHLCHMHYYLQPTGKSCIAIRKEVILLGAIFTKCYRHLELNETYIGNDFSIKSCKLIRRPDMLFMFKNFALLIECDEKGHKDRKIIEEEEHLMVIKQWILEKYDRSRVFQVRINPDGNKPMFKKMKASNGEYIWKITSDGENKIDEVLYGIKDIIDCGLDNTDPEFIFKDAIDDIAIRKFFF